MSPAGIERENVAWCDRERYYERNREIVIFKINRMYEEFMERLGVELSLIHIYLSPITRRRAANRSSARVPVPMI